MAFNPLSEIQILRLKKSIEWSEKQLQFPRQKRVEGINLFIGPHHSDGGSSKRVPVNVLRMAVNIYVRILAPHAPRAFVTTKQSELMASALNLELAVNQVPKEIGLTETFRCFVTEALFSLGILKCGLHGVGMASGQAYGESFVDNITMDDYFLDMSAKRDDQIQYEGNTYWLDYEEVMESDWIRKKARDGLEPDEHTVIGPAGESRAEGIATNESATVFKERLWLRDVWLPKEKLLVTLGVKNDRVFNIVEWDGPKRVYYKLGFGDVPGNLLPLPPVAVWRDLHELGNALYRKLGNQADSEKTVLGFPGGGDEDAEAFQGASDGDGITFSGLEPKTLTAGGINPTTLAFFLQNRDLFSYVAGNLDSLGGLSPLTETVGQDKLLSEAAGAQLQDMSVSTTEAMRDVFEALAYYEWHDPIKRRTLAKQIPGTNITIPTSWGREEKIGDISLYDLEIDVYSLQGNTPGLKLQKLGAIMQNYILPLAPLIEREGGSISAQKILEAVARYSDMPEVKEIVTFVEQQEMPSRATRQPGMPANTTRTYERVGRPGMSRQGASAVMQQQLLGKGMQASEAAQVGGGG